MSEATNVQTPEANAKAAHVDLGDQSVDLPVVVGTENEHGIDTTSLRGNTGYITVDPGFGNTGSCKSAITFINGEQGILRHRGYPIEQLAKHSSFLEAAMLIIYGIWSSLPFSFIVFYAGLQSLPEDAMEAAMIDGASKWQRMIHVVVPHLMPLVVFISLIQLMDNFRVFEPIISFQAEAHARSLSWIIYNDLIAAGNPLYGSAGATSILTIIGVAILLMPVLIRTWRDFNSKPV